MRMCMYIDEIVYFWKHVKYPVAYLNVVGIVLKKIILSSDEMVYFWKRVQCPVAFLSVAGMVSKKIILLTLM